MKHIVCFSGGHSSAIVAIMVAQRYPQDTILLNHDINPKYEDADIKRFKREVAAYLGLEITYANLRGQTVEQLPSQFDIAIKNPDGGRGFKKPNSGDAFCTYYLKTEPFNQYLAANFPFDDSYRNNECIIYYGFDDDEQDRIARRTFVLATKGYNTEYPLANWPATIEDTSEIGIARPATYGLFKHGNCVGCLKAGMLHWYVVYCTRPDIYAEAVETEKLIGYTLMRRDDGSGKRKPLSLEVLAYTFQKMREQGLEASEHAPRGPFLKALKEYKLPVVEDAISCECFSLIVK